MARVKCDKCANQYVERNFEGIPYVYCACDNFDPEFYCESPEDILGESKYNDCWDNCEDFEPIDND